MGIRSGAVWAFKKFTSLLNPSRKSKEVETKLIHNGRSLYMKIRGGGDGADTKWEDLLGAAGTIQLPGDLMIQIISRLPIKSILRFKSVCRAWYYLFSHPVFIQHCFRIAVSFAKMNNLLSFVIHTRKHEGGGDHHLISLLLDRPGAEPVFIYPNLPFEGVAVMGSINGLVCLDIRINNTSIVLWNPATRKHSHIINPQLASKNVVSVHCGFTYDHKTDIYKFVRVFIDCLKVTSTALVEIYNTGTNTWRMTEIADFPWKNMLSRSGVEVAGVLYWFSSFGLSKLSNSQQPILSFDVSSEALRFHLVPHESADSMCFASWRLQAMGEHLVQTYCVYSDGSYDSWRSIGKVNARKLIKSDDGGEDSFHIEKLTIEILPDLNRIIRICRNGKIIAEDLGGKLLVFDREETKYLPRELRGRYREFYEYTESLLWPSTLA